MKAELYKFKKDISVWIISFILVCCASISIFTEVYSSAENTVLNLGKDSVILILACAIYVGFSCTDDFTNRTVIYAITYGNRRLQILLAKYFCYIFGCTIIIISYMFVSMVISFLALGTEITLHSLFMYAVKSLLLSWGNCNDFLLLCYNNKKINYGNKYFSCVFHYRSSVHK